jgi:hypothetical protein
MKENLDSVTGISQILRNEEHWCSLRRILNIFCSNICKGKGGILSNNNVGVLIQIKFVSCMFTLTYKRENYTCVTPYLRFVLYALRYQLAYFKISI